MGLNSSTISQYCQNFDSFFSTEIQKKKIRISFVVLKYSYRLMKVWFRLEYYQNNWQNALLRILKFYGKKLNFFFNFGFGIGFGFGMQLISVLVALLPIPKLPIYCHRQKFRFWLFTIIWNTYLIYQELWNSAVIFVIACNG
jgi:hypothetical protein